MKVLCVYPKSDDLIRRHVELLTEGLKLSADISVADTITTFRQALRQQPDIIHCHGCSSFTIARLALRALGRGARLVITPHGQLEPWVTSRQPLSEKVGKTILWQKDFIAKAYAVILLGRLERVNFTSLKWNRRTEEIHNAVTTNTISQREMCSATFAVYQKILDSNTLEQMDEPTLHMLRALIKVGIMGDRRWYTSPLNTELSPLEWRRILLYAEHEHIRNYVDYGISLLGLSVPSIDTANIPAYMPDTYTPPRSIREIIGDYKGDETDYLMRIISQIHKQPLLLHLIELTRELYRDTVDDSQLAEALEEKKLTAYTASLMQVLDEQTGLDEGYMPLPAADNRQTRQISKQLTNHLKI